MVNFNMCMILETSHPYLTEVITSHSPGGRHAIWTAVWAAGLFCLCMYCFHLQGKHLEVRTTSNASSQGPTNTTGTQEEFTGDRWYVGARRPGEHLPQSARRSAPPCIGPFWVVAHTAFLNMGYIPLELQQAASCPPLFFVWRPHKVSEVLRLWSQPPPSKSLNDPQLSHRLNCHSKNWCTGNGEFPFLFGMWKSSRNGCGYTTLRRH